MTGESLATPLVTESGVVIYTIDGRLRMLSLFDGSERWSMEQDQPVLTLRGSSSPIIVGGTIMVNDMSKQAMKLASKTREALVAVEEAVGPLEGILRCFELCKFNGGLKFYDESAEYECGCKNGIAANFDFDPQEWEIER